MRISAWTFFPSQLTMTSCPTVKSRSFSIIKRVDAIPVLSSFGKDTVLLKKVCLFVCTTVWKTSRDYTKWVYLELFVTAIDCNCEIMSVTNVFLYEALQIARIENPVLSLDKWNAIVFQLTIWIVTRVCVSW